MRCATPAARNCVPAPMWPHGGVEIDRGRGSDISVILYTSGTTGKPKGVMLSHENIVVSSESGNLFDNFTEDDTLIAYLPMATVGAITFSLMASRLPLASVSPVPKVRKPSSRIAGRSARLFFRPTARIREHADFDHGADGRRQQVTKAMLHYFLKVARGRGRGRPTAGRYRSRTAFFYSLQRQVFLCAAAESAPG